MDRFRHYGFEVRGLTPLLQHNPAGMRVGGITKGKVIPPPEEEAEAGTYRMGDGVLGAQVLSWRIALVSAAGAFRHGRRSLRGYLTHAQPVEELVPLLGEDGEPIRDYEIDIRRAVVQRQGILRARPRIWPWQATPVLAMDPQMLPPDPLPLLQEVMSDAGVRFGVGDYRPEKGGWFGTFEVVRVFES